MATGGARVFSLPPELRPQLEERLSQGYRLSSEVCTQGCYLPLLQPPSTNGKFLCLSCASKQKPAAVRAGEGERERGSPISPLQGPPIGAKLNGSSPVGDGKGSPQAHSLQNGDHRAGPFPPQNGIPCPSPPGKQEPPLSPSQPPRMHPLQCAQGNHQQRIDGQRQQQPRKHPSVQLGDLLLRGWTMLGEHCPNCQEVPLMRHPRSGLEWCVQCEKEKEKEEAQTTNASCHDETQEISGGRATHDRQAADNGIIYHRHHQPQPQHGGRKEEDRKEKETKQSEKAKEGAETEREKENLSMMEQKSAMDQKGEERGRQRNRSEGEQHQAQPLQPSSRLVNVSSSEALESTRKLLEDRILVYATELSKCSHMDFDRDESILSIMEKACALLRSPPFRYPSQ